MSKKKTLLELPDSEEIKKAASILGRKGGLIGGNARANALTPKKRSEIAKKAADTRWHNEVA